MKNIDLYLNLDGIILRRTGRTDFKGRNEFVVAPGAMEFLSWASEHFNCYWLTSRSHDGGYCPLKYYPTCPGATKAYKFF